MKVWMLKVVNGDRLGLARVYGSKDGAVKGALQEIISVYDDYDG